MSVATHLLDTRGGFAYFRDKHPQRIAAGKEVAFIIHHVLAAISITPHGHTVAHESHALARQLGARLTLLHVLPDHVPPFARLLWRDLERTQREAYLSAAWFMDEVRRDRAILPCSSSSCLPWATSRNALRASRASRTRSSSRSARTPSRDSSRASGSGSSAARGGPSC